MWRLHVHPLRWVREMNTAICATLWRAARPKVVVTALLMNFWSVCS